jgi:hypothetical protein
MRFRHWLVLSEASQQETQALKLLGGDERVLAQLRSISPEPKFLPVLALLHRDQPDLVQLGRDWGGYKRLLDNKKMPPLAVQGDRIVTPPNNQPITYLQWTEKVHAMGGDADLVRRRMEIDYSQWKPPIFKNEELEVYETDGPGDCIRYGKGYSFCISQPGNTMWQSYRDQQASTFYFVYDKSRGEDDPLHIVVVDMTEAGPILTDASNRTGEVAEYGRDARAYLNYLFGKGVPRDLFKNKERTEEEEKESRILGSQNKSLAWFKGLSPDHKSKYIGRGHELSDEQFDYILDNGMESLVKQYAEVGTRLNGHQMERILNSKFRSTYLHFRVIADQQKHDIVAGEWEGMSEEQRSRVSDESKFAIYFRAGKASEAEEMIGDSKEKAERIFVNAAKNDDLRIMMFVRSLRKKGAIRISLDAYEKALMHASYRGHEDVVEYILERNKDLDYQGAAMNAAWGGHLEILKMLMDYSPGGMDPYRLRQAAEEGGHEEIIDYLGGDLLADEY